MKKWITALFICVTALSFGQQKNCKYDYEQVTDTLSAKKTTEYMMDEKIFGANTTLLQFSLLNHDDVLYLGFQLFEKNNIFIPSKCIMEDSKIFIQLKNGKIVTLKSTQDVCSQYFFEPEQQVNTNILTNYYVFNKQNFEDLKTQPISMIRVQFGSEHKDYVPKKSFVSEITKESYYPENYFMVHLDCVM